MPHSDLERVIPASCVKRLRVILIKNALPFTVTRISYAAPSQSIPLPGAKEDSCSIKAIPICFVTLRFNALEMDKRDVSEIMYGSGFMAL